MNARASACMICGASTPSGEVCQDCELESERTAPANPEAAALSLADAIEQLPADAEDARYHARQARSLLQAHQEAQR